MKKKILLLCSFRAVQEYKKEFHLWQSGVPVDIKRIRSILLPLLEKMGENACRNFLFTSFI